MDYEINDLNVEKIVGSFYEKKLHKTNKKKNRIEKVIKRKEINFKLDGNGKGIIIILIVGLMKKDLIK